ncbi:hypothetical protein [Streptacidiphilus sp. EB103A]|uniref:hypothetical protein n=1 Tax=Streptacidiphilus sp. EB103A TaxID=3156275 RepID=UPI003510F629
MSVERDLSELLRDDLHAVLDELPEGHAVDVAGLVTQGRRRLRKSRGRRVASAVAATVGAACLAVALVPDESGVARPSGPVPPAATTTAGATADPVIINTAFGWLPAQLNSVSYVNDRNVDPQSWQYTAATPTVREKAGDWTFAQVSTQPWDVPDIPKTGRPAGMVPIGSINGHPAYAKTWTHSNGATYRSATAVLFRSASGQTAELETWDLGMQDTVRIARGVVFAHKALPVPLRVTGVDAPVARAGAEYDTVNGKWTGTYLYLAVKAAHNYEAEIGAVPADQTLFPTTGGRIVDTRDGVKVFVGLSDTYISGLSLAKIYPEDGGADRTHPNAANDPTGYGDPTAFLKSHITNLGAEQSRWTTSVLAP